LSTLSVLSFQQEGQAQQVLTTLRQLQEQNLIQVDDAAIFTRKADGKPSIKQASDLVGTGALGGAFWGMLLGILFFMPLIGAAIGAAAGALGGKRADYGISDDFIKQVGASIQPGQAALFLLTEKAVLDKVVEALKPYQFQLIHTSLSIEEENKLREIVGQTPAQPAQPAQQMPATVSARPQAQMPAQPPSQMPTQPPSQMPPTQKPQRS